MKIDKPADKSISGESRHQSIVVAGLCLIAACRLFLFNAAFPLFNNVDEEAHFDLVNKYSQGRVPRRPLEKFDKQSGEFIILYGSPEYNLEPQEFPGGSVPPPWTDPYAINSEKFKVLVAWKQRITNHESWSMPSYYMAAGLWTAAGRVLGITGGRLLYWIRFLNVPLYVMLVIVSYEIAKILYRQQDWRRIGLPLLAAFFPQDCFYAITNDSLSPLISALSFLMLIQLSLENKGHIYYLTAGLTVATTFMIKITNISVLALLGIVVGLEVVHILRDRQFQRFWKLVVLLLAVAAPIGIWLTRSYTVWGSLTGIDEVTRWKGWSPKPLTHILQHPIFTFDGSVFFLSELIKTFWRGEFVWHGQRIASPITDTFYVISTAVFFFFSACRTGRTNTPATKKYRFALRLSLCTIIVSVVVLIAISIRYDFGRWPYPSRQQPFLTSGRLISGSLVPFCLIYLDGLHCLLSKIKARINPLAVLTVLVVMITCTELALSRDVFSSMYNWFHLK